MRFFYMTIFMAFVVPFPINATKHSNDALQETVRKRENDKVINYSTSLQEKVLVVSYFKDTHSYHCWMYKLYQNKRGFLDTALENCIGEPHSIFSQLQHTYEAQTARLTASKK